MIEYYCKVNEAPIISREILSLRRREDGVFEIYADGELVEEYEANADTWGALLPIKLWRHFNNIVEKRIKGGKE